MRQRYKPWANDYIKNNSHLIIPNASDYISKWRTLFNNQNPIHLEIGTGKGQFLVGMAKQYPNINFIGIELEKSVIVVAAQKMQEANLKNVLLLNENAMDVSSFFSANEISGIYLNFSDPWPKNRHEKRRLTYHTFLEQYKVILKPGSEVVLKTDNQGLFEYSLVSFSQFGMTLEEVNLNLHEINDSQNIMTEYEEKFAAKRQAIYRCRAAFFDSGAQD
ncbi:tRNA (guanosine(46)-N7)-methyltransferase TrmB [Virgibacillus alimentarius]|uniref:tRNA (guanine-N(7)-)-methyltransferase n=1 Tax=Virgibacillus alimentarius TaxID=698769 RepID=A0ABS4SC50_9BACI|nr:MULTISPECIES: tRNA (guanosine(46)-N7)-methyltransferase TrmB [Virgibacillus]MBP2259080.1 tRNA (guanine-N7-)-methyltransferase [Virgibacillus alimentarius]HLR68154.1 tRNA (guanosine(46)-N7)-methyltransferase TrmB [Virgibacillus sp.]